MSEQDPVMAQALEKAHKFYEMDHVLTKSQRETMESMYKSITVTSVIGGWGVFFAAAALPPYIQKLRTGSTKGVKFGLTILLGFGSMALATPTIAQLAYAYELEKLTDRQCRDIATLLKHYESSKWWFYYNLTKSNPDHIVKDPYSKEVKDRMSKPHGLLQNKDPMGLYTKSKYETAESQQPAAQSQETDETDDPFEENPPKKEYISSWDRIRLQNGIQSAGSSGSKWNEIRSGGASGANSAAAPQADEEFPEKDQLQSEFDQLLQQELLEAQREEKKY